MASKFRAAVRYVEDPEDRGRVKWERLHKGRGRPIKPRQQDPVDELDLAIEAFIEERRVAGKPLPDRQAIYDRIAHVLGNVDGRKSEGTNSRKANAAVFLVHRDEAPYFGVGTEAE